MDYKELLEDSFLKETEQKYFPPRSRLEYLSRELFRFITSGSEMDELFARKAVEVCSAITNGTTLDYIKDQQNHMWFVTMCNMPFFSSKMCTPRSALEVAWWDSDEKDIEVQSSGLWKDGRRILSIKFSKEEWKKFMRAIEEFINK